MNLKITFTFASLAIALAGCATDRHGTEAPAPGAKNQITEPAASRTTWPSPRSHPWGTAYTAPGYVLVRVISVGIGRGYEMGGERVGATLVPVEYKYPEPARRFSGFGGGGGPVPSDIKPVETAIGKPFQIGLFINNSLTTPYQQSIGSILEACVNENDPKHLNLNLILFIPTAEASSDWPDEHDYSHWFVESLEIAEPGK